MNVVRKTPSGDIRLEGKGLHSGIPVTMTIRPAEDGIHFRVGSERVAARPENVTDTTRSTKLGPAATIEHVMSALAGMGVTDAEVELSAGECPGLDGSAGPIVTAIQASGPLTILGEKELPNLFARVFHKVDGVEIAIGKGDGHWRYEYDMGDRWPGRMPYECLDVVGCYAEEIAPARTFYLAEEIPMIEKMGLGQGLDANTALMLGIEGFKGQARFPDEPARHKLLDLIGDLALAGIPVDQLSVVAVRSGHKTNVEAAHKLWQAVYRNELGA